MADFSIYATPSEEWAALAPTLPPIPSLPPVDLKNLTNATRETAAAQAMVSLAPLVHQTTYSIPTRDNSTIEARTYRPVSLPSDQPLPVYIHLHGGGFLFGTLSTEDATCAKAAIAASVIVLNVNYRHTPEFKYPTAWNDVEDAFLWLHDNIAQVGGDPKQIVIGGISAGAYLTASLVLQKHLGKFAADKPAIAGQVLMIPSLVNPECYGPVLAQLKSAELGSWEQCKDAPILGRKVCQLFTGLLEVHGADVGDMRMNPGNASAEMVRGLPPSVFGVAGLDPLRDEGLLFAKRLAEEGVPTGVHVFPGVPHGFRRFGEALKACERWDEVMEGGITWCLGGPVASGKFVIQDQ
ncbi:hypothetical protein OQA88_5955 [Cercophora sp. LCS_1]